MPNPARNRLLAGAVLIILGVVLWALSAVAAGHEQRADAHSGPPPRTVTLTAGRTYWLAVPGGIPALPSGTTQGLVCTQTSATQDRQLSLTGAEPGKAIDQIGSFIAPFGGSARVTCAGVSAVWVDNADGSFDARLLLLVLATIALTVGVPLAISGAVSARNARAAEPVG